MEIPGLETPPARRGRPPLKAAEPEADAGTSGTIHKLDAVRDRLDHLKGLARAAKEAGIEYAEAIEAVAEKSRIDRAVLRAFVNAAVGDKPERKKAKAEQLALLFEEIGA